MDFVPNDTRTRITMNTVIMLAQKSFGIIAVLLKKHHSLETRQKTRTERDSIFWY
jgi:hypothetical protein